MCRTLGLLRQIHLARLEAAQQLVGRDIDQYDLVSGLKHRVGHGLMHTHTGNRAHRAVQAFKVLHIERRPHIYARLQQFLHILPAFGMPRALDIAVRQLVHQQHSGLAHKCGIKIKLFQAAAPVGNLFERQLREPCQQLCRVTAAVGFHHTNQHVVTGLY